MIVNKYDFIIYFLYIYKTFGVHCHHLIDLIKAKLQIIIIKGNLFEPSVQY